MIAQASNKDKFDFIMAAGRTIRCHATPCIKPQSVADHSWGVAALAWWVTAGQATGALMAAAMAHDAAECVTGDIPSPTRSQLNLNPILEELEASILTPYGMSIVLTWEEERILRFCDIAELAMYCIREIELGNRTPKLLHMLESVLNGVKNALHMWVEDIDEETAGHAWVTASNIEDIIIDRTMALGVR